MKEDEELLVSIVGIVVVLVLAAGATAGFVRWLVVS